VIVNVHIDRLVLDGLPVGSHEGPLVGAAVEAELARLFTEGGLANGFNCDRAAPLVRTEAMARPATDGGGLGVQIGQAVYEGIVQ
jgi:hypothetical protein